MEQTPPDNLDGPILSPVLRAIIGRASTTDGSVSRASTLYDPIVPPDSDLPRSSSIAFPIDSTNNGPIPVRIDLSMLGVEEDTVNREGEKQDEEQQCKANPLVENLKSSNPSSGRSSPSVSAFPHPKSLEAGLSGDIDTNLNLSEVSSKADAERAEDVLIIDWEGPDDPEDPKKCVSTPA